ncbi:NAD-dependent epimerase/dehydratase family protein [Fervidobacterium sp.]
MILITGATGHLGNVLVKRFVERGERVRIIIQPKDNLESLQFVPVEVFYSDVRWNFSDALKDVEAIFHLASVISITPSKKKLVYSVNIDGTKNVIRLAKEKSIPLVYVSSVHAFAEVEKGSIITEEIPVDEDLVIGDYAKSKAIATKEVEKAFKEGLDGFIVFPTGIFGPYDYKMSYFSRVIIKYKLGALRYTINGKFDFVDVRDLADSIVELYKILKSENHKKVSKQRFIISGHDIDFAQLPKLCGLSSYKILDDTSGNILSVLSLLANIVFSIPSEFVPYALHTLRLNYTFSKEKLSSTLPYTPRKIEDSIHDFFNWLNELNKRKNMCYNIN